MFSLVWNAMCTGYKKSSCFEIFGDGKYGLSLSQKVDGKMIFTGY